MPSTDETSSTRHFSRTFRLISPVRFMRVESLPSSTTPWAASKSTPKAACCERMDRASMDYSPPVKSSAAFTARIVSAVTRSRSARCSVDSSARGVVVESAASAAAPTPASKSTPKRDTAVTRDELAKHASALDCWVALYGKVYDFTDFLEDHPQAPTRFCDTRRDGTKIFEAVHSKNMLDDFEPIGTLVD